MFILVAFHAKYPPCGHVRKTDAKNMIGAAFYRLSDYLVHGPGVRAAQISPNRGTRIAGQRKDQIVPGASNPGCGAPPYREGEGTDQSRGGERVRARPDTARREEGHVQGDGLKDMAGRRIRFRKALASRGSLSGRDDDAARALEPGYGAREGNPAQGRDHRERGV